MGKDKLNVALFNSKGTSTIEPSYGSAKGLSLWLFSPSDELVLHRLRWGPEDETSHDNVGPLPQEWYTWDKARHGSIFKVQHDVSSDVKESYKPKVTPS